LFVVRGTGQIYGEGSFGPGTLADDSGNSELVMGWVHPWVGLGGDLTAWYFEIWNTEILGWVGFWKSDPWPTL